MELDLREGRQIQRVFGAGLTRKKKNWKPTFRKTLTHRSCVTSPETNVSCLSADLPFTSYREDAVYRIHRDNNNDNNGNSPHSIGRYDIKKGKKKRPQSLAEIAGIALAFIYIRVLNHTRASSRNWLAEVYRPQQRRVSTRRGKILSIISPRGQLGLLSCLPTIIFFFLQSSWSVGYTAFFHHARCLQTAAGDSVTEATDTQRRVTLTRGFWRHLVSNVA